MTTMDVTLRMFLSLAGGALLGAALGLGIGLAWVNLVETSGVQGYTSMLVFFGFAPIGSLIGCVAGGCTVGIRLLRHQQAPDSMSERPQ